MFVFFCIFVFTAIYFCNVYLKNRVQSRLAVANTSQMFVSRIIKVCDRGDDYDNNDGDGDGDQVTI